MLQIFLAQMHFYARYEASLQRLIYRMSIAGQRQKILCAHPVHWNRPKLAQRENF